MVKSSNGLNTDRCRTWCTCRSGQNWAYV